MFPDFGSVLLTLPIPSSRQVSGFVLQRSLFRIMYLGVYNFGCPYQSKLPLFFASFSLTLFVMRASLDFCCSTPKKKRYRRNCTASFLPLNLRAPGNVTRAEFRNGVCEAINFYSNLFLFRFFLQVSSPFSWLLYTSACVYVCRCVCVCLIKNRHNLCTIYQTSDTFLPPSHSSSSSALFHLFSFFYHLFSF